MKSSNPHILQYNHVSTWIDVLKASSVVGTETMRFRWRGDLFAESLWNLALSSQIIFVLEPKHTHINSKCVEFGHKSYRKIIAPWVSSIVNIWDWTIAVCIWRNLKRWYESIKDYDYAMHDKLSNHGFNRLPV